MNQQILYYELSRQRRYGQIESLQSARRCPENHTDERRNKTGGGNGEPEGKAGIRCKDCRGIGPDSEKSAMTERYLPRKSYKYIQADNSYGCDSDHVYDI